MNTTFAPICMTEEFWANSQFSIARCYGQIKVGNHTYVIVYHVTDEVDGVKIKTYEVNIDNRTYPLKEDFLIALEYFNP